MIQPEEYLLPEATLHLQPCTSDKKAGRTFRKLKKKMLGGILFNISL